jgi:DNA-binding transcriptional MocR family regulator
VKKKRRNNLLLNGRNKITRFVQLEEYLLASPAYRSLLPIARALLVEIKRLYNGYNNGELFLSIRGGARLLGVAPNTAAKAFDQLMDRGFIRVRRKGSFDYKQRHAREWVLTEYALGERAPEKAYMDWPPGEKLKRGGRV